LVEIRDLEGEIGEIRDQILKDLELIRREIRELKDLILILSSFPVVKERRHPPTPLSDRQKCQIDLIEE
jgi:hypothetical protein